MSDVIHSSGFLTNLDSVGIMDGVDEGIFSWFTVNFLLGKNTYGLILFVYQVPLCFMPIF